MRRQLFPAMVVFLAFTLLTGIVYPLAVTGIAQLAFPGRGERVAGRATQPGRRLAPDRAAVQRRRVLPAAPVGGRTRLRRDGERRL
jgi:hypothetical protein